MRALSLFVLVSTTWLTGSAASANAAPAATPAIQYVNQGPLWTDERRTLFYSIDQGSQLIPMAWLKALRQSNGKPFLDGSMARYGFLPTSDPAMSENLPVGFEQMPTEHGGMVGIGCAACHVRQMNVGATAYRLDGGPSFNDFLPFARDLDEATKRVHDDEASFDAFAGAVLGDKAKDPTQAEILRADFDLWWTRYHTFIDRSLPRDRLWGPARMDAISLIYNRLAGLDIGPPPTYLIPGNIEVGHAPVRYPFLWNASRQDITQWTGFAYNGSDFYRLTRNLGEEYGVFGTFHPQPTTATFTILNRNYLIDNSANMPGLGMAENLTKTMGPPVWPWAVDEGLVDKGKAIFERATAQGGCADCHGIKTIKAPPGEPPLFKTPVIDVGTDRRSWQVILRKVDMGSLKGAAIQDLVPPLQARDTAILMVRADVVGAIADFEKGEPQARAQEEKADNPKKRIGDMAFDKLGLSVLLTQASIKKRLGFGPPDPPPLVVNGYEARVLQGIWAAAPYLHNGSVPSLTELLKSPGERVKSFKIGTEYDPATIGLAANQPASNYTLNTTGCDDLQSGDSNCGHDYGTHLSGDDKKALLEYLKTL